MIVRAPIPVPGSIIVDSSLHHGVCWDTGIPSPVIEACRRDHQQTGHDGLQSLYPYPWPCERNDDIHVRRRVRTDREGVGGHRQRQGLCTLVCCVPGLRP
jgi:hypothetical protein